MNSNSVLTFVAAAFSGALALAVLLRKRHSVASWCFSGGMATFALEAAFNGISFNRQLSANVAFWQGLALLTRSSV